MYMSTLLFFRQKSKVINDKVQSGDVMKKVFIKGIIFVIIGFYLGSFIFGTKVELVKKISLKKCIIFCNKGYIQIKTT